MRQLSSRGVWQLPLVFCCLRAPHLAVRIAAASTVAACCERCPSRTMEAIVDEMLPLLAHASNVLARVGAAHAIQAVLGRLGDSILPYVVFLVAPILGRMGDSCRSVRQACTQSFATLVKLMPLESAIPDPVGMRPDLLREKGVAREFLAQAAPPPALPAVRCTLLSPSAASATDDSAAAAAARHGVPRSSGFARGRVLFSGCRVGDRPAWAIAGVRQQSGLGEDRRSATYAAA